jgi:hypothetical protein
MAIDKPVPVPEQKISSVDQVGWVGGLNLNGIQNSGPTDITATKDVELDISGFLQPRRVMIPFLPDTVEVTYKKAPIIWNGLVYYFTLDNNVAKFCLEGDTTWTNCGSVSGSNSFTTNNGGKPKFVRVLDHILVLNGKNGDKLAAIDLTTSGFPVIKYTAVADPTSAPTAALTNLTTGVHNIYYAFSYSGNFGETNLTPILTQSINITRDQWQTQTSPGKITLTFPGTPPTGATFRNVYVALAATGGVISATDMLQLDSQGDISATTFVDDGSLDINLGNVAPTDNSTDAPRVNHAVIEDGNPILFGDEDNSENIWIGGGGAYALSFSTANNGYLAQPEKGTNFTPSVLVGFRNGQGLPSLTVLYTNTEGLAKQAVLEQQTVTYGTTTFSVWGVTEQHYGAAGVAATNSAINYNGKLLFLSNNGFMSMNTQPLRQNVISTENISIKKIDALVRAIKGSAMDTVVGAGWDNRFMWTIPNDGFDTPQQILIQDDNHDGAYYTLDIPAQWIDVVTPVNAAAFVYISQGKSTYKLVPGTNTFDIKGGVPVPFSTYATGSLAAMAGGAHNSWQANVQVMFNILSLTGSVTIGVTYRNQNGNLKTKSRVITGPSYIPSSGGGWGDTGWSWGSPGPSWSGEPVISISSAIDSSIDTRKPVRVDNIINEGQWFISSDVGFNYYKLRAVSFEGISLGILPDLQ